MNQNHNDDQIFRQQLRPDPAVPSMVRERIKQTLAELPETPQHNRKNISNKRLRRNAAISGAAAAMLLISFLITGLVSPAAANAFSKFFNLGALLERIADPGLQSAEEIGIVVPVQKQDTNNGITLSVNEVIYDGLRLVVTFTEFSESALPSVDWDKRRYASMLPESSGWWISGERYVAANANTIEGVWELQWLDDERTSPPESFDLPLEFSGIGNVKGTWQIHLQVTENNSLTRSLHPMMTNAAADESLTIKSATLSPTGTEIRLQSRYKDNKNAILSLNANYQITDDNGRVLALLSGDGYADSDDEGYTIHHSRLLFEPLGSTAQQITVRPYSGGYHKGDIKKALDTLPLTVAQGEIGSVTVTAIERLADRTVLHYEIRGDLPYEQAGPVWLMDAEGNVVKDDSLAPKMTGYSNGVYTFERELPPVKAEEPLLLLTKEMGAVTYYESFEMALPIVEAVH